ncbi:AI-2E family transporter [Glutamicibacter sp. MNS18]|uniref:AI-2E family transporter n=1 Tax=Glutamicibacter sp. MNS18 TaxID=2989817 RepID=UPI00223665A5|nr:AI-2E family transporter [Glutamicibacter sp. MNS18]MCW4465076.1 AI-2E family transporter [Glutamicibacter sp. MNS18]
MRRLKVVPPVKPDPQVEDIELNPVPFDQSEDLPYAMRIAASWAWRFLVVVIAAGVAIWLLSKISLLLIPLMIAALLTGLLGPLVELLNRKLNVPRGLAVGITVIGFLAMVVSGLTMVGQRLGAGFSALWNQVVIGIYQVQDWLFNGPLQLSNDDVAGVINDTLLQVRSNASNILGEALSWGSYLGQFLTGILLAIFALVFLLLDGRRIGTFLVNLLPRRARPAMDGAATRGWNSMVRYVRVQVLVAFIDAVGIGLGAYFLGVPLVLPLGVLVFLGSFIPILGALVTGALAVLLALVANGWVNALIMLAVVLVVQQAESNLLQPLIMGKAVSLHPLAVVMAVAGGTMVAGIAGALFAVPILAVLNSVVKYIAHRAWEHDPFVLEHYGSQDRGPRFTEAARNPQAATPRPSPTAEPASLATVQPAGRDESESNEEKP